MRRAIAAVLALVLLTSGFALAPGAQAIASEDVSVSGAVAAPTSYTLAQLQAMPQTTLPDTRSRWGGTVSGVLLADLVIASAPILPAVKNAQLRIIVTVSGSLGSRAFAFGELDPGFGNHPALLALESNGHPLPAAPWLAVPADRGYARTVIHVTQVTVAVATPGVATDAPAGGLVVQSGTRSVALDAAALAALPQHRSTVSFSAMGVPQTHIESGPALAAVLRAAGVTVTPTTSVTAVGTDGYAATVTPAEATSGRRPLLLSIAEDGVVLAHPRLVAVGDVKGGRDVTDVVKLSVTP